MPVFSIIIPTYNSSKTISKAVKSIVDQTYTDWEILICDGLSKDDTLTIARSFGDGRIKTYTEKDDGVYDAMNKGLEWAKGEWFYFLGSDDYLIDNQVLEKMNEIIAADKSVSMVYGNVFSPRMGSKFNGEYDIMKLSYINICHQAIFYNRSLFEIVGKYNLKYKLLADWDFNIRCFLNRRVKVRYIDQLIAYYADYGMSAQSVDELFINDRYAIIREHGYKHLPIRQLRLFCESKTQLLQLLFKRFFNV